MAYPLRVRFRTGVTLAMFTLVVFTIVVGATTSRAFLRAVDDVDAFGGGFDVTAQVAPTSPLLDAGAPPCGARSPSTFTVVGQRDRRCRPGWRRRRPASSSSTRCAASTTASSTRRRTTSPRIAKGYGYAARRVAGAVAPRRPRRRRRAGRAAARRTGTSARRRACACTASTSRTRRFDPVDVVVRDPRTGTTKTLTVIGVLADTVPIEMAGLWTSHQTAAAIFGAAPCRPSSTCASRPASTPDAAARRLERAFLENGMEAKSVRSTLHEALGASYTVNWLLLGFMGLGLIVGVAALGVVSARAVVERRQQIGVLRSIGFRRGMVAAELPARVVLHRAHRDRRRQRARPDRRLQRRRRRRRAAVLAGRAALRGAVGAPGDRLRRRLRRGAARPPGPRRPRGARLPRGGVAL